VRAIDVATGAQRVIDANSRTAQMYVMPSDDRVRYITANGELIEVATQPGAQPTTLARDVTIAAVDGERMLIAGASTLRLLDASGEHLLLRDPIVGTATSLVFSGDGIHAAVAALRVVIEFDLTTQLVVRRWSHSAGTLFYRGSALYADNRARAGVIDLLATDTMQATGGDWSIAWVTPAAHGLAVLNQDGDVLFTDPYGIYTFSYSVTGARVIAGRPDQPIVAIGSQNGWIRWFDTRQQLPASFPIPPGAQLCGIDGDHIYVASPSTGELLVLPRDAKAVSRSIRVTAFDCLVGHAGPRVALVQGRNQWLIVNGETGDKRRVVSPVLASSGTSFFFLDGDRDVTELSLTDQRVVWSAPAPVEALVVSDRFIVVGLADHRLVRIDRTTGTTTELALPAVIERLSISRDGVTWFGHGRKLYRADHEVRLVGTLPATIESVYELDDGTIVATSISTVWHVTDSPTGMRFAMLVENLRAIGSGRTAVSISDFTLAKLHYLDTGEQVTHAARSALGAIANDNLLGLYIGSRDPTVLLYTDPVPQDPQQLHAWIDSATNAVLEPGSDDLLWR
jgi:outer membrane protein assembly factor BamB